MIDPKVRDDFYGIDKKIFLNNASYAPLLKPVKQRMDDYFQKIMGLDVGDAEAKVHLDTIRENAAKLIGASIDEVGFTLNTSVGVQLAVLGFDWQSGDEVLIPENEFPTVPYPFVALKDRGVVLKFIPTPGRVFSFDEMTKLVTPRTKMLAMSFVQYFNGYRNDLKRIGEFCKERGIYFVVDAMQGLGACPLNAKECHIDLLACGGQKWLLSPLGTGFYYESKTAKKRLKAYSGWMGVDWKLKYTDLMHFDREPFDDPRRFNLGTYPYLQLWGMSTALDYLLKIGIDNIYQHNRALADKVIDFVQSDDYYSINGSTDPKHRSQIVSIASPAGPDLQKYLLQNDFLLVYREGGVRIAVNFYNTEAEVDRLILLLKQFKEKESSVGTTAKR